MKPQRIIRPATAFSVASTKQRRPRDRNEGHLKFIRRLHCCICGAPNPDAAHIRAASAVHGKSSTGLQEKPSDRWVTPLCRRHHDEQHAACERGDASAEITWWAKQGIDPFGLALSLYAVSGDDEIGNGILRANRAKASILPLSEERT
jgi:hypothetical protein